MSMHLSTMYKPALQRLRAGSFDFVRAYAKLTVALCIFIALASAALGLRTALKAGPIWDDPTTIVMMQVLIGVGAHPETSYETGIAAIEVPGYRGAGYYGAVTQFTAHALETIANRDSWLHTSYSADAIAWRHLVCFIMTMCAAGALFLTASRITGDRRVGLFMLAALLSTPVFIGMSVINEKDAPIAAGMTLLSCGSALMLWQASANGANWRSTDALAALAVFLGTAFAFGTRVGALALIGVECVVTGVAAIVLCKGRILQIMKPVAVLGTSVLAGVALATMINPLGRKQPISWIFEGIAYARHPVTQPVKLYGVTVDSGALPWWYVPGWLIGEYSLAFWLLVGLGVWGLITLLSRKPTHAAYVWAPFVAQGLLLPVLIVFFSESFYDRLRHFLFMIPPWCMLAGFGVYVCVERARRNGNLRSSVLAVLATALLIYNFAMTVIWYPYQYVFLSEIARLWPQFSFDSETLGLSVTESIARMREHGITEFRAGPAPIHAAYEDPRYGEGLGVVIRYVGPGTPHPAPVPGGGAYYLHTRPSWGFAGVPRFCHELFRIERQGVILGVGAQC
jgi:hypothetical protein